MTTLEEEVLILSLKLHVFLFKVVTLPPYYYSIIMYEGRGPVSAVIG